MNKANINYKQIFRDILEKKYPHKKEECISLLNKEYLSVLDVITLNKKIFGSPNSSTKAFNQSHRAYNESTVIHILNFQKKHHLNNSELAIHFKISRHTISKWRKEYFSIAI
ncbi:helix-turn-helix domain-containing protein [Chryseobacterium potabilaquae]|uniref:Helix-turn-helix domain-containing protein n=1 Tax=Chryseobacterium potabilaquae TaxID=2675057 RepID=A0A6N4XC49_9FLAO|nr:helix-turn-helix domain-containing protein [Chryseobacterium potabilaquae]CAA7196597.1 hypothetical protein CHRY9293_02677 [Chryseobacterium potabilaquae]